MRVTKEASCSFDFSPGIVIILTMNSSELELVGLGLFGPRWKSPLARVLGISRETVSRWAHGSKIPSWGESYIRLLVEEQGTVLSLCDRTGNMVKPWARAGFECICVDLQHVGKRKAEGITWIEADVRTWIPPPRKYRIVFAFPPCTNLASSGARWFKDKGIEGLMQGIEVVEACRKRCEWAECPWMLENPVGTLSSYWRKPDYKFDPYEYAGWLDDPQTEAYTKKTCLWAGGGFLMPSRKSTVPILGSKMHKLPPSADRGDQRSVTPNGFAQAVFNKNSFFRV